MLARLMRVAPKGSEGNPTSRNASDTLTATFPPSAPFSPSPPPPSVPPSMPTCRRKRVLLIDTPPSLLQVLKSDPNKHVFYLAKTGEIFDTYEQASTPSSLHLHS